MLMCRRKKVNISECKSWGLFRRIISLLSTVDGLAPSRSQRVPVIMETFYRFIANIKSLPSVADGTSMAAVAGACESAL